MFADRGIKGISREGIAVRVWTQDDGARRSSRRTCTDCCPGRPEIVITVAPPCDGEKSFDTRVSHGVRRRRTHLRKNEMPSDGLPAGCLTQNCAMKFQTSAGMKAFTPSSPADVP